MVDEFWNKYGVPRIPEELAEELGEAYRKITDAL